MSKTTLYWEIKQIDVDNAFLYEDLKKTIYTEKYRVLESLVSRIMFVF